MKLAYLLTPRTGVLVACALLLLGVTGLVSSPRASAAGTCVANTGYSMPAPLALDSARDGVTVSDAGASTYGVGGTTEGAIRSALDTCAPSFMGANKSGEFLAYTSYSIDWSYSVQRVSPTTCRLTDVKVGLGLSQLLPSLTTGQTAPSAIRSKWSAFITGLKTHEDGHKALDIAQANKLYSNLVDLQVPCATIAVSATGLTNAALNDFLLVNAEHDTDTDYGRNQGATW